MFTEISRGTNLAESPWRRLKQSTAPTWCAGATFEQATEISLRNGYRPVETLIPVDAVAGRFHMPWDRE